MNSRCGRTFLLVVTLASSVGTPSRARAEESAPASAPPAASTPSAPTPTVEEPSRRTVWPWIIGGTGLALIITGAVLEVVAVSENKKRDDLETQLFSLPQGDPKRASLQADADTHHKSATNGQTAALIIGTVGFLAVAGSVVWWFFESPSSPSTSAPAASLKPKPSFTPLLGKGLLGATLGTTF